MTEVPTQTLAGALDALRKTAAAAGLEPETAIGEGEALAAAVAESAEQAYVDWASRLVMLTHKSSLMRHIVVDAGALPLRCCSDSSS